MTEWMAPVQHLDRLSKELGVDLHAVRDDLLPFPLPGNKVRKIEAELKALTARPDLIVTTGAVSSNHCRTTAFLCAERGLGVHLVLHGDPGARSPALRMLRDLGAGYTVVAPHDVAGAIADVTHETATAGRSVHTIAGGCHTPAGALSYRAAAECVLRAHVPAWVVVASGTGATQGGIAAAAAGLRPATTVVGVSVARTRARGLEPVRQAATWAGAPTDIVVDFRDDFIDGGYGLHGARTDEAVSRGWRSGLPLDPTYTGKAFAGLLDMVDVGEIRRGEKVLFWHTGGLAQYLFEPGLGQ